MDGQSGAEKRAFFRMRYPQADRPVMRIGGLEFAIAEVSEGGIEIFIESAEEGFLGDVVSGEICFSDGELLSIEGEVLRSNAEGVFVKLSEGISMKRMISEQLRLKRKYPEVSGEG